MAKTASATSIDEHAALTARQGNLPTMQRSDVIRFQDQRPLGEVSCQHDRDENTANEAEHNPPRPKCFSLNTRSVRRNGFQRQAG